VDDFSKKKKKTVGGSLSEKKRFLEDFHVVWDNLSVFSVMYFCLLFGW